MSRILAALATAVTVLSATSANAAFLAAIDFDASPTAAPGVSGAIGTFTSDTARVGAWNAYGWSGRIATNRTTGNPADFTTLQLSGIGAHTSITASFVLGFLESWDSRNGSPSPDNLEIWVDGVRLYELTADNASGNQEDYAGFLEIADDAQVNTGSDFYDDALILVNFTFAHTASTLNLGIRAAGAGWQGADDEAWGIDNLQLTYQPVTGGVPEPGAWALMIAGFGLAGSALRRRRALAA